MADVKSIALGLAVALAGMNALAARSTTPGRTGILPEAEGRAAQRSLEVCQPVQVVQTDAHKPVTYHFALTNTTEKAQTVESVRTSCACLKVTDATGRVPPGGVLPFEVVLNPAGMEGRVEKRVWVTLAPSKKIVTFDIAADVRLRLGFKPMDAAFGVIRRSDTSREIVAQLSGYVADCAKLGMPFLATNDTKCTRENVFDVRIASDGKSIIARFRDRNVLPGMYSETWTIPTGDSEIPAITFAVSARVADEVSVTPQVITVGWDEPVCSRVVMLREGFSHKEHKDHKDNFVVLSAETKPRKWGDVKITQRPMNGWSIDIENIDPREVRQFSKRPFLEVKTNLPGMESFEIPLRVVYEGGMK